MPRLALLEGQGYYEIWHCTRLEGKLYYSIIVEASVVSVLLSPCSQHPACMHICKNIASSTR